jgi:hypothetical protein
MVLPMLADSGDTRLGLPPLGLEYAVDAVIYANDLNNAKPASGAVDEGDKGDEGGRVK